MNVVPIQQEMDLGQPKFSDFWLLWSGKKIKRKDTERLFNRLRDEDRMLAIIAAADWREIWLEQEHDFRPDPCRWIEGDRWEDEMPKSYRKTQAYQPAKPRDDSPKSAMPDYVRSMIAKLRVK